MADVHGCRNALKRFARKRSQDWSVEVSERLAKAAGEQSALTDQKATIDKAKKASKENTAALQAKLRGVLRDRAEKRSGHVALIQPEEEEAAHAPPSRGKRGPKAKATTRTTSTLPTQDLVQGLTMSNLMHIAYNNWVEDDPDKFDEYLAEFSSLCSRVDHT